MCVCVCERTRVYSRRYAKWAICKELHFILYCLINRPPTYASEIIVPIQLLSGSVFCNTLNTEGGFLESRASCVRELVWVGSIQTSQGSLFCTQHWVKRLLVFEGNFTCYSYGTNLLYCSTISLKYHFWWWQRGEMWDKWKRRQNPRRNNWGFFLP